MAEEEKDKYSNDLANFINDPGGAISDFWGSITGSDAAEDASRAQSRATELAKSYMDNAYGAQRREMEPWSGAGMDALSQLMGSPTGWTVDGKQQLGSQPAFMKDWEQDPGYKFRMSEGLKAINAAASAGGRAGGGRTMKDLMRFGQDYASQEYGKVYDRGLSRLGTIAGMGYGASGQTAQHAGQYGQTIANLYTNLGQAQAGAAMMPYQNMMGLLGQMAGVGVGVGVNNLLK